MGFDPEMRKKIRAVARDEPVSEKELFESPALREYLSNTASTLLDGRCPVPDITVYDGGKDGPTASTNKGSIVINWRNNVVQYFPKLEQRFVAFAGMIFHELAHDIFLDFDGVEAAMDYIGSGKFYGAKPKNLTPDEEMNWQEMEAALADQNGRAIFQKVFHEVQNIIADTHDENALIDEWDSFVGEGIYLCRNSLHGRCPTLEDMLAPQNGMLPQNLPIAYNLLLQITRFGFVLVKDEETLGKTDFGPMLDKVKRHAEIACVTDDPMRAFSEMNYILLALWPFIKAVLQQDPNSQGNGSGGSSGSSSGNQQNNQQSGQQNGQPQNQQQNGQGQSSGPLSPEQVKKVLEQLAQGSQNAGQTQTPESKQSSETARQRKNEERKGKKEAGAGNKTGNQNSQPQNGGSGQSQAGGDPGSQALQNAMNSLMQTLAESKAEKKLEKEQKAELENAIRLTSQTSPHKGVPLIVKRNLAVYESDKIEYETLMRELSPISKRLQRQIADALRDLKEGYTVRHRVAGNILAVNDTYRPDGRWFANKKLPQDLPDMALSILVDHSGSMSGERIRVAKKAAMLLYDFATGIDIPVSVAGHRTDGSEVQYIVYTDFEKIGGRDKYRLAQMSASGCNRDGMALNISAGLLEKRPEEIKLLIIISDGNPNHTGYSGKAAGEDIQQIVHNCKRKGIEVIAAAIGNDRKQIQDIYRDEFLDISDLSKLPRVMTNIVKKRVLRNAF